jgi:uncharacterized Zn finger protein
MFSEDRSAYRDYLACPHCRSEMHVRSAGDTVIELCPRCGGVYLDWTDGDPKAVLRDNDFAAPEHPGETAQGPCPKCKTPLAVELLDERCTAHRCANCFGLFLPASSITQLQLATDESSKADDGWLSQLKRALQTILGW